MFLSAGCSFLRAEGFSCSMYVVYGGLGITKSQICIKEIPNFFGSCKMLDPDPDPH